MGDLLECMGDMGSTEAVELEGHGCTASSWGCVNRDRG